ncbi:MAG TPA: cupin domain-containing protein [Xanthobacteraceae bacterium]|nr:cupin domain-containing protein [Xanthobacteraceae bacterium]
MSGIVYDFRAAGDELPMHAHTADDVHISIMTRGRLMSSGDGWQRELKPGDIVAYEAGQRHNFVALEPGSRVVNIIYGSAGRAQNP